MEDSLAQIQKRIVDWADKTFPNRTPHDQLCKLVLEEIPEFLQDLHSPGEYADLLILLLDIAHSNGIDIVTAVNDKMDINESRVWEIDPVTGLANHVKMGPAEKLIHEVEKDCSWSCPHCRSVERPDVWMDEDDLRIRCGACGWTCIYREYDPVQSMEAIYFDWVVPF